MLPLDELVLRCRAHRRQADVSELIRRLDNLIGGEVAAAARRWWRVDRDDLRQQAIVGLLVALDKYDPDRGAFISLARVWIKDSLARYAERQTDVSRPNSKTELWIARHAGRLYLQHSDRDPEMLSRAICELIAAEGAAALGCRIDADRVEAAMALSMGRACGEEMARLEAPEDDAGADLSEVLAAAIEGLPDRERRVIRLRFGAGEEIMSLDAIAAEIGQTREACRKVMLRGLAMLREALEVQGCRVLFESIRDRQDAVSAVAALCRAGGWETERRVTECCELLSGRVLPVAVGLRAMGAESAPGGWWRVRCDIPSERDALKWQAERQAISI